ncbi:MAG: AMP-binding protein [Acidimicrobiia bacterium]|nr:AMP-binding protein [Acidimicrobiia bacterium]
MAPERTRRWYDAGFYGTDTMRDRLAAGADSFAHVPFRVWSPQRPAETTLGELHSRGVAVGGALLAAGVGKGDVVALQMPNWLEAAVLYHACTEIGAVVLPIIHIYGPAEVGYILDESGAAMLVTPDTWMGVDYSGREVGNRPEMVRVFVGDDPPSGPGVVPFEELEANAGSDYPRPDLDPDDVHLLCYTSGTTAKPKGVQHSHNTMLAESRQLAEATGARDGDVFLCPNPVGHMAGILAGLQNPYLFGEHCILMDGWDPQAAAELISDEVVTRTGGAPFFLTTLLDHVEAHPELDVSSLGLFGCGGAGVLPSLIERADAVGWWSFRSFGSSEHPSITSGYKGDPLSKRANTDGRPMPGVEVRIVDEAGASLPVGAVGEIQSIGPDLFLGYTDPALDADAFTADGWYRTGDLGYLDADGFLTVTDRIKDIIIRGGENISAVEVEDVLVRHPKVREVAVTSVPDARYGEKVCAFVIPADPADPLTFDELVGHFAAAGVAKQKTPERLEVVDDFPRTLAGKVKKYLLRENLHHD